jgi:hypothetical protein
MAVDVRRETARALFERLERELREDEFLADKQCVRMILDKAAAEQAARSRKRFDVQAAFRSRLVYPKMDDVIADWCRRREIRTDPYNVFRYEGKERGPTQHETAVGPSLGQIGRFLDRLAEEVPEIPDCRSKVLKAPTKAIAPAFRLQHPLPFGAAGEIFHTIDRAGLDRGVYLTAMEAATGGDPSRGWRYDCGLFICHTERPPRDILGDTLFSAWPDIRERVWHSARTWVILV